MEILRDVSWQRQRRWYVMLHLEPQQIERLLQMENGRRRQVGLPLYEYFIPYRFLPHAVPDKYADDADQQAIKADETNDLRSILHQFVFIKATSREVSLLVDRPWNREGRLHLHFYRTRYGRRITMSDTMMTPFITLCCQNRQQFSFGPPVEEVARHDVVVISQGAFKDFEATVLDVQHTAGGISMTLGIPMFCGEKTLRLYDYRLSDIHLPRSVDHLLNDRFLDNVEAELLDIVRRRVKGRETSETRNVDAETLNYIYHYSYIQMHGTPSHGRFRALMLICAALRGDREGCAAISAELLPLVGSVETPASADEAYLLAALYMGTANADYRTAAKKYRQQHPIADAPLSRLMPLVTRINKTFFRHQY